MDKTPNLAGALEAMNASTRGPRVKSPVYEWLAARHDALVIEFAKKNPAWKALAKYLADGGVLNADGKPATPAAVRSSWLRVEANFLRKGRRHPQTVVPEPAAPVPTREPAEVASEHRSLDAREKLRAKMKPVTALKS